MGAAGGEPCGFVAIAHDNFGVGRHEPMFWRRPKLLARRKPKKKRKMKLVLSSNYHCHVLGQPGMRIPKAGPDSRAPRPGNSR